MKKLAAFAFAALGVVGCSDDADEAVAAPNTGRDECPAAPEALPAAAATQVPVSTDGGPELAGSPVDVCRGRYRWNEHYVGSPAEKEPWLRRTSSGCMLDRNLILKDDGTVDAVTAGTPKEDVGTWSGDEFYFTIDFKPYKPYPTSSEMKHDIFHYGRLPTGLSED